MAEDSEGASIEETLQIILEQIFQQPLPLQAASRTDAGVHAVGQVVNCRPDTLRMSCERLLISLNSLLPDSIRVLRIEIAPEAFHPTLDCKEKEYHYWICNGAVQLPQHRFYSWHLHQPLNLEAMVQSANLLVGRHDFAAFCNALSQTEYEETTREIRALEIVREPDQRLRIIVRGPNFLYRMVRNLVGTLADIGGGKLAKEIVPALLEKGDRKMAGVTAPAHGLMLYKVSYDCS